MLTFVIPIHVLSQQDDATVLVKHYYNQENQMRLKIIY
jgi:hypothetical protein